MLLPNFTPLLFLQSKTINKHISVYGKTGTKTLRLGIFRDWDLQHFVSRIKVPTAFGLFF